MQSKNDELDLTETVPGLNNNDSSEHREHGTDHSGRDHVGGKRGYTDMDLKNPNINCGCIEDKDTPLVILFGPKTIGKTMALIRLTQYLRDLNVKKGEHYNIRPISNYRPAYDDTYKEYVTGFDDMISSLKAAKSTGAEDYVLVEISENNHSICQIIEAPGEHFFNPNNPEEDFHGYLKTIFNSPNRKIWVFVVSHKWGDDDKECKALANRIAGMKPRNSMSFVRNNDKIIFLCTKVDEWVGVFVNNKPDIEEMKKKIGNKFPGMYAPYENTGIMRWIRRENFTFVPFSVGSFTEVWDAQGKKFLGYQYDQGDDYYPAKLWDAIRK